MDIPDDFSEIRGLSDNRRFVPVLEEMADALMFFVEVFRIHRKEATHEGWQQALGAPQ